MVLCSNNNNSLFFLSNTVIVFEETNYEIKSFVILSTYKRFASNILPIFIASHEFET